MLKRLSAPGNAAGDRVDRLGLAAPARRRARIDAGAIFTEVALYIVNIDGQHRRESGSDNGVGAKRGTSAVTGRPSLTHLAKPPSSTATVSWPTQRSIHHSRAAMAPFAAVVGRPPGQSGLSPCWPSQAMKAPGSGRGWRPLVPLLGAERSRSRLRERRAREMCLPVLLLAELGLGEVVAAVEDPPRARGCGWDERVPSRRACAATRGSAPPRLPSATGRGRRRPGPVRRARGGRGPGACRSRRPRSRSRRRRPAAPRRTRARRARSPRGSRTPPRWWCASASAGSGARRRARSDTTRASGPG